MWKLRHGLSRMLLCSQVTVRKNGQREDGLNPAPEDGIWSTGRPGQRARAGGNSNNATTKAAHQSRRGSPPC